MYTVISLSVDIYIVTLSHNARSITQIRETSAPLDWINDPPPPSTMCLYVYCSARMRQRSNAALARQDRVHRVTIALPGGTTGYCLR